MAGYYKTAPGSMQDLAAQVEILDFLRKRKEEDMQTGGPAGRFMQAQQQRGYDQSAQQLDAYLKMAQVFPSMAPTPQAQRAANVVTGNPWQQIMGAYNLPVGGRQTPLMPAMSPWLDKTQAEIQAFKMKAPVEFEAQTEYVNKLADFLKVAPEERRQFYIDMLGARSTGKVGELTENEYEGLTNDIASIFDPQTGKVKQKIMDKLGTTNEDEAKQAMLKLLIAKYGVNQAGKIEKALGISKKNSLTLTGDDWAVQYMPKK